MLRLAYTPRARDSSSSAPRTHHPSAKRPHPPTAPSKKRRAAHHSVVLQFLWSRAKHAGTCPLQSHASGHVAGGAKVLATLRVALRESGRAKRHSSVLSLKPVDLRDGSAHNRLMLRAVTGGVLSCVRRQKSVRRRSEASRAGSRVMFSGCWGQRSVRNGIHEYAYLCLVAGPR